jgi:hypothetical protein
MTGVEISWVPDNKWISTAAVRRNYRGHRAPLFLEIRSNLVTALRSVSELSSLVEMGAMSSSEGVCRKALERKRVRDIESKSDSERCSFPEWPRHKCAPKKACEGGVRSIGAGEDRDDQDVQTPLKLH